MTEISGVCSISTNMEKFSLKWNDFQANVSKCFRLLMSEDELCDVTLVTDDQKKVSAHKLVLSACSEYFKNIFKGNKQAAHPFLCLEGISSDDLSNMLDYIYKSHLTLCVVVNGKIPEQAKKVNVSFSTLLTLT